VAASGRNIQAAVVGIDDPRRAAIPPLKPSPGVFFFRQGFNLRHQQPALLQQPAEILLAGMAMFAVAGFQIFEDLVTDLQPLEMNDADEFIAMFPNLALLEFQRHVFAKNVSPDLNRGETIELFLLAGRLFAGDGRFLVCGTAAGLGLLLTGLLLVRFRGFISHDVCFLFTAVYSPAE
jgi:hypothetical protein